MSPAPLAPLFFRTTAATALLITSAAHLMAGTTCPTAADLGTGVIIERNDPPLQSLWMRKDGHLTEKRSTDGGDQGIEVTTSYAHGLLPLEARTPNGVFALEYHGDITALEQIADRGEWSSAITLNVDGQPVANGTIFIETGDHEEIEIGDCTYPVVWTWVETHIEGREPSLFDNAFAPSLGLSLAAIRFDEAGEVISGVMFDSIAAR